MRADNLRVERFQIDKDFCSKVKLNLLWGRGITPKCHYSEVSQLLKFK